MREIRFRGKSVTGEWVHGSLIACTNLSAVIVTVTQDHVGTTLIEHDVDPGTVGQYTGLKDKNGVKVFEGDIVEREVFAFSEVRTFIGKVEMYECAWWIDSGTAAVSLWNEMHEIKVIGNIHENPEWLKEVMADEPDKTV